MSYNPGGFKSVQSGSITIATSTTSNTATISAVSVANAVLVWCGCYTNDNVNNSTEIGSGFARMTLTNSTTITATRGAANASFTVTIKYYIVEYTPGLLKSVQYGTVAGNGATSAISAVDTSRTYVGCLGEYGPDNDVAGLSAGFGTVALSSSTAVVSAGGTASSSIGFVVVEFY